MIFLHMVIVHLIYHDDHNYRVQIDVMFAKSLFIELPV